MELWGGLPWTRLLLSDSDDVYFTQPDGVAPRIHSQEMSILRSPRLNLFITLLMIFAGVVSNLPAQTQDAGPKPAKNAEAGDNPKREVSPMQIAC